MEKKKSPLESHLDNRSCKKLFIHFDDLIVSDKFTEFSNYIRNKYLCFDNTTNKFSLKVTKSPNKGDVNQRMIKSWNAIAPSYFREIAGFCDHNGLNFLDFGNIIDSLIRNEKIYEDPQINTRSHNLLFVETADADKNNSYGSNDLETHPISIRVSPYAGCGDIVDYVNSVYSSIIQPLQKKYRKSGIEIGKRNKRPKKEITAFMIKKHLVDKLSLKETAELSNTKFNTTRYTYVDVSNLIAAEQKRRKNM